jgi:hypothetical protein
MAIPQGESPEEFTMASVAQRVDQDQTQDDLPPLIWVTPEEGRRLFDEAVRARLDIGGDEFIRRWEAGEYDEVFDKPGFLHIGDLAFLIPFARQDD